MTISITTWRTGLSNSTMARSPLTRQNLGLQRQASSQALLAIGEFHHPARFDRNPPNSNMTAELTTSGLFCLHRNPVAQIRLFCFHHAGGSAAVFRQWFGDLPDHIELWTVQLSGRAERSHEPPLKR